MDTTTEPLEIHPGLAIEKVGEWADGAMRLLPNVVVALVAFLLFYGLASLERRLVEKGANARDRENLGSMLGSLARWAVIIVGGLLAATIVIPSLNPGDVISGLGIGSVAIGFAFKDILQNWLAGLLLLLKQPFEIGDQIEVAGFEGTVKRIESRATMIQTYDGQRVVMPNSEIYTNAVLVKTGRDIRRSEYDVGIGYADDLDGACDVISKVLSEIDGVLADPAPEALPWDLAASWVTIRARWWTTADKSTVVKAHAQFIRKVKYAFDESGIDMPFETLVQLVHDQTEDHDGDRAQQREGWPNAKSGPTTPRWRAREKPEPTQAEAS